MKKILITFLTPLVFCLPAFAQLEDGSLAPDFTASDMNGDSWNLQSLLDQGKIVVLNFFASWDQTAWQYKESGELQNFYNQFGPSGSDEVMVLHIESEPLNTSEQLLGPENITNDPATQTWGNWMSGHSIPIIDQTFIADSFQISYLPTMFMICPNGAVHEVNQISSAQLFDEFNGLACPQLTVGNDAAVVEVEVLKDCGIDIAQIRVKFQNLGTNVLTGFNYQLSGTDQMILDEWIGNLSPYQYGEILIENVGVNESSILAFEILDSDENTGNNSQFARSDVPISLITLRLELGLDNWPEEVSWEIRNESGEVIFSDGDFSLPYEYFNDQYTLPALGCYSFYLIDTGGDGLHGSQFGGFDGSCYLYCVNDQDSILSTIYSYDGSYNFSNVLPSSTFQKVQFLASEELGVSQQDSQYWQFYPNPADANLNIKLPVDFSESATICIYDSAGNLVKSFSLNTNQNIQKSIEVETMDLSHGIYFLKLASGKKSFSKPFAVIHE